MRELEQYTALAAAVDRRCADIAARHARHIACTRGCRGNCCRVHLTVFAVEAFHLALALKRLAASEARDIRRRAAAASTFGPCPLLDDEGACRLYGARLVICRTHGLPMRSRWRGHTSTGCCPKNFTGLPELPRDALIDLDALNRALAAVNRRFVARLRHRLPLKARYFIAEALLLDP